jgi:putative FmdB family regulatory protein
LHEASANAFLEGQVPTYQYACTECGDQLEVVQRFTDDPLTICGACGGKLRKVFSPVGIVFKGSGFYRNDSRSDKGERVGASANGKSGEGSDGSGTSESGGKSESGAKAESGVKSGANGSGSGSSAADGSSGSKGSKSESAGAGSKASGTSSKVA